MTDQAENSWVGWDYRYNSYEAGDWYLDGDAGTTNRSPYQYANRLSAMSLTIDRIKNVNIAPEKLARYTAELKCGIGFLAFLLYDMYGPIPLPDMETLKNPVVE